MGNQRSDILELVHPVFGRVRATRDKMFVDSRQYTLQDYNHWEKQLAANRFSQTVLIPLSYSIKEYRCGVSQSLEAEFPLMPITLACEIKERAIRLDYFSEPQLWFLLLSLAQASRLDTGEFSLIGDVQPKHVLLNQKGLIKLLSIHTLPGLSSALVRKLRDKFYPCYISPEQEVMARHNNPLMLYDQSAAQSYSLAMVMLDCANLSVALDEADFPQSLFVPARLRTVKQKYSGSLYTILGRMLQTIPSNRLKCNQLYAILQPYIKDIKGFKEGLASAINPQSKIM